MSNNDHKLKEFTINICLALRQVTQVTGGKRKWSMRRKVDCLIRLAHQGSQKAESN